MKNMFTFIVIMFVVVVILGAVIGLSGANTTPPPKKTITKVSQYANAVKCPNCQGVDVDFISNNRKGFSVGKAVGGAVLTGGIGAIAGFAGKKGKTDHWHCRSCGTMFERKR